MNDFDFDCLEKKRLARNAFSRKGTRGRKGCRLPHENLTKKELEKMNGEVYSVSMNTPISWERFKTLTPSLQSDYLNHLVEKFGVGINTISRDLFGLSVAGLANHINRRGLKVNPHKGKIAQATYDAWYMWLNGEEPSIAPVSETAEEPDNLNSTSDQPVFRAHDYEDMLRECDLAKKDAEIGDKIDKLMKNTTGLYPLTDMSLTLEGKPVDVLAALQMSWPWLLDQNKTYRVQIKLDTFVSKPGVADKML